MAITSITRVRLGSWRYWLPFVRLAMASGRQARHADGFLGGYLGNGWPLVFWTVTQWRDKEAMRAFRNSGVHLQAMPRLKGWCVEAAVATIESDGLIPVDPEAAARLLAEHGHTSAVERPSAEHEAGKALPDGKPPVRGLVLQPAK